MKNILILDISNDVISCHKKLTIPDQGKDGVVEAAVVEDLCAEEEVSELDEGSEDDEEHDEEADHVSGAPAEGPGQLRHGLDITSLHITALDNMYACIQCHAWWAGDNGHFGTL